jgi:hypothetical protein
MAQSIRAAASLVLAFSPSLMLFLYAGFVKSNNHGHFPEFIEQSWIELLCFAFAAAWQLLGVYALAIEKRTE